MDIIQFKTGDLNYNFYGEGSAVTRCEYKSMTFHDR